MNYKPQDLRALGKKVIIKLDKWDNRANHGIILAKIEEITPCEGIIVSKGPRVESKVFIGDKVRTREYAGLIFWINDDREEKYVSIDEGELDFVWDNTEFKRAFEKVWNENPKQTGANPAPKGEE